MDNKVLLELKSVKDELAVVKSYVQGCVNILTNRNNELAQILNEELQGVDSTIDSLKERINKLESKPKRNNKSKVSKVEVSNE